MSEQPIKIALFGMDERTTNWMALFLIQATKGVCELVPLGGQEVTVVDLDVANSSRIWFDLRRQFSGPVIVLSLHPKELRDAIWVQKPIKADRLLQVLDEIRSMLKRGSNRVDQVDIPAAQVLSSAPPPERNRAFLAPERIVITSGQGDRSERDGTASAAEKVSKAHSLRHEYCGNLPDEFYKDPLHRKDLFFDPALNLLGVFKEAVQRVKSERASMLISGLGQPLVFCADGERVFCEFNLNFLRPLAALPRSEVSIQLSPPYLDPISAESPADPRSQPLDLLLWSLALWSSRGRVPVDTPLDEPIRLKRWPNLTRLPGVPGAMQMAALWYKQPMDLLTTAVKLKLPYRHVFSFYTACYALNLVEIEQIVSLRSAESEVVSDSPQATVQEKAPNRGLFARILNKIGLG
jgi:hypothetical protein